MDLYEEFERYVVAVKKNDLVAVQKEHRQEFLHKLDENDLIPLHLACNRGNMDVVKFILSKNVNIEFPSPFNSWRALHWAVGNGYEMVGKLLLEHGADKEAKVMRGLRPLHCAAMGDHYMAVQVLLAHGVDMNTTNERNETAMQMAIINQCEETVKVFNKWISYENIFNMVRQGLLEACKETFIKERVLMKEDHTELTVLDVAVESNARECLEYIFLQNIDEKIVYEALEETFEKLQLNSELFKSQFRLYRSILFDYQEEFRENATVSNVNRGWVLTGETFLEVCSRYKRALFIPIILEMLLEHDQSWERAVNIAAAHGCPVIGRMITTRQALIINREKASYNRLHLAIQDNNVNVIRYILENELVDPNRNEPMLGSPLCLALSLGHMDSVHTLCEFNVDFNKTNKSNLYFGPCTYKYNPVDGMLLDKYYSINFNQTPMHIALEAKVSLDSMEIINIPEFVDHKDCYGFTSLHMAVINKDERQANALVEKGANILMPLQIQQINQFNSLFKSAIIPLAELENPLTLSLKLNRTIFPSMLSKVNNQICDNNINIGDSLLHLSAKLLVPSITESLISKGFSVNSINMNGNTPLHSVFLEWMENCWEMEGFVETINTLIRSGANINTKNAQGLTVFNCAMNTNSRNTVNVMLNQCEEVLVNNDDIFTLYQRQWADILKSVLDLQDHEFKRNLLSNYILESQLELIDFILDISDAQFIESIVEECICLSAQRENFEIFEKFLEFEIPAPRILPNGETLLTKLILDSCEKFSLKFCQDERNHEFCERKNQNSLSPLYCAANRGYLKLFKCLLLESQNADEEINGKSAIDLLMDTMSSISDFQKIHKLEKIMKSVIKQMPPKPIDFIPSFIGYCKNPQLKSKLEVFYLKNKKENSAVEVTDEDINICEICLMNKLDCVFPCGHPFCKQCSDRVELCPKCRQPKIKLGKLYLP